MVYVKARHQQYRPKAFQIMYLHHTISIERVGGDRWHARVFPEWSSGTIHTTRDFKTRGGAIENALTWVDRNHSDKDEE